MHTKLKNRYNRLIAERKRQVSKWHRAYQDFHEVVVVIRERIKAGGKLHPTTDEQFLRKLLGTSKKP